MKIDRSNWINKFLALGILLISLWLIQPSAALAHRPHDVIEAVAVSPTYQKDQTVFIIVRGIPMKSTDGGQNWQRMVEGLDNHADPIYLTVSPQAGSTLYLNSPGDGIYKSEDTGTSWFKVNQGIDNLKIRSVAISPHAKEIVLANAYDHKLYLTEDGGKNWQTVLDVPGSITAISFSSFNDKDILAGDNQGNLYVSQTGGKEWKTIKNKLENNQTITSLAFTPDNTWFVGTNKEGLFKTADSGLTMTAISTGITDKKIRDIFVSPNYAQDSKIIISTWADGIFISTDKGKTWQKSSEGLTKTSQADEPLFSAPHFDHLKGTQSFAQDKTLYLAGFNGLFKSTDGGQTWQELYTLSIRAVTALGVSPNYAKDGSLALGTYEGEAYLSEDQGKTWKSITNGLSIVRYDQDSKNVVVDGPRFFDIEFSPGYSSDNTLFASLIYQFTKSTNKGGSWHSVPLSSNGNWRDIYIAASPNIAKDKTVYLGTKYGGHIYRSTDRANRFSKVGSLGKNVSSLKISPNFAEDKTLYAATFNEVDKSTDGGITWSSTANDNQLKNQNIAWRFLAISPNYKSDQTVLAGTNQGIFKSTDAGKTWVKLAKNPREEYLADGLAISPDYGNDQTFIVSARGIGLVKTTDGGKTFVEIGQELNRKGFPWRGMVMSTSNPIAFSPNYASDKTLYGFGSNSTEIYKSTDGGNTWEVIQIDKQYDVSANLTIKGKATVMLLRIYSWAKFIIAVIIALLTYWLVGYLRLEKLLPLSRVQIKVFATIIASAVVLIGLWAVV